MKKIGVVGLGIMGSGMAENFLKNGYELYVWNRHPEKADSLVQNGAKLCKTPKEVAEKTDVVFEVTANDVSSKQVWTANDGILAGARKDSVLIASATLSAKWTDELAKLCQDRGFTFFDMPLTGGRVAAESGNLTMLVGGDETKLEELKLTLKAIAGKVFYFGPAGHGTRYKLLLNMLQAIHMVGFGEAIKIAEASGMDIDKVSAAFVDRPGGAITTIAKTSYHNQPDPITFSVEWITKDLGYAKKLADSLDTPLLDDVLTKYRAALDSGKAQTDWTNINEG
ncbi:MAG TPA: NAD(P)-dependent oxidoreductase [Candidatus Dormibacteraeota bacterium]|nr:NAD(P)-dependent oxidoreductase [Candidatus Dormibacteraeota bacterium]